MNRNFSDWLEWADESLQVAIKFGASDVGQFPSAATWHARQTLEKFLKTAWIRGGDMPPVERDSEDLATLAAYFSQELPPRQRTLLNSSIAFLEPFSATQYIDHKATPQEAREAIKVSINVCTMLKTWLEARA